MVWGSTSKIGCGFARCSNLNGDGLFVCNYGSKGNVGDFSIPYLMEADTGICGACPENCVKNLCGKIILLFYFIRAFGHLMYQTPKPEACWGQLELASHSVYQSSSRPLDHSVYQSPLGVLNHSVYQSPLGVLSHSISVYAEFFCRL